MEAPLYPRRRDPQSRCPTSTSHRTRFSSCKTSPSRSQRTSSTPSSPSASLPPSFPHSPSFLRWLRRTDRLTFPPYIQISQPIRSPSHSDEEGHCVRGVPRRGECECGEGCTAQLQARRGEQDQGASLSSITSLPCPLQLLCALFDCSFYSEHKPDPMFHPDHICQEVMSALCFILFFIPLLYSVYC